MLCYLLGSSALCAMDSCVLNWARWGIGAADCLVRAVSHSTITFHMVLDSIIMFLLDSESKLVPRISDTLCFLYQCTIKSEFSVEPTLL